MFSYSTVEEKAEEWGVTARHIQHLCRNGKIEGVGKRAGVWFIPADAPSPVKNGKAGDKPFRMVGTKKKIFDSAVKLFTQKGYENVSIHDIAKTIGIRQSAVYNHFKSKQDILDTIYGFYTHKYSANKPNLDEVESLLKTGSLMDILTKGFRYDFDEGILEQMSDITKIIVQRASTDAGATEIFQKMMLEEGVLFVEQGLDLAVKAGRLAPLNTHVVAVLINSIRLFTLLWWLAKPPPEVFTGVLKDEFAMYEHITVLMQDLKPPAM